MCRFVSLFQLSNVSGIWYHQNAKVSYLSQIYHNKISKFPSPLPPPSSPLLPLPSPSSSLLLLLPLSSRSLDMLNTTHTKQPRMRHRQSSLHGSSSLPKRTGSGTNLQILGQSSFLHPPPPTSKTSPKTIVKDGSSGKDRVSWLTDWSVGRLVGCSVSRSIGSYFHLVSFPFALIDLFHFSGLVPIIIVCFFYTLQVGRKTGDSFSQYYSATICDVSSFLPVDYKLAKSYRYWKWADGMLEMLLIFTHHFPLFFLPSSFSPSLPPWFLLIPPSSLPSYPSSLPLSHYIVLLAIVWKRSVQRTPLWRWLTAGQTLSRRGRPCTWWLPRALSSRRNLTRTRPGQCTPSVGNSSYHCKENGCHHFFSPSHCIYFLPFFVTRFAHYAKLHDVQTLALLACICQLQCQHVDKYFKTQLKPAQDPVLTGPLTPYPERKIQQHAATSVSWLLIVIGVYW